MFYRIVVNVIYMLAKVGLIANLMFPKPLLPDGLLSFAKAGSRLLLLVVFKAPQAKPSFDALPPRGKVGITFGQSPNAVDMVRQNDDGVGGEGRLCFGDMKGLAK
ncbi:hypothetical protein NC992_12200 [Leptolyngbya subtilissima DQ-A4]|uniref:Uncharacterized protein n=1 Tax=Leptolyngbya subtilissima DQ-A4 TaxID=2933933 RepID=A0ABV0K4C4_9CYAN|nr:hypothetical protein [Nodosilinea sp. FACHB-141]